MEKYEYYLGDGVTASFEGDMIWLRTTREYGVHEIALEPEVWESLKKYVHRVHGEMARK